MALHLPTTQTQSWVAMEMQAHVQHFQEENLLPRLHRINSTPPPTQQSPQPGHPPLLAAECHAQTLPQHPSVTPLPLPVPSDVRAPGFFASWFSPPIQRCPSSRKSWPRGTPSTGSLFPGMGMREGEGLCQS